MRRAAFRRLIFQRGLAPHMPGLRDPLDNNYGVPFDKLPNPLHDQILGLLESKTAEFDPDRPRRAKMREISAESLKREFCRIYGYATKILEKTISTLPELLNRELITAFAGWCLNKRKVCGCSVEVDLGRICGVRYYPLLASMDFSWLPKLMANLPKRSEEEIQAKKEGKWLDYDILDGIPERIRETPFATGHSPVELGRR